MRLRLHDIPGGYMSNPNSNNNNQPLRQILPAGREAIAPAAAVSLADLPRKRRRSTLACEGCRTRRIACDGDEPACGPCRRRDVSCAYRLRRRVDVGRLQDDLRNHAELVAHLRALPEPDAIRLLRRLRAVPNLATVLASVERGAAHSAYRPSDLDAARAASPPTATRVEFELMMSHRASYHSILPLDISLLERLVRIGGALPSLQDRAGPRAQYCDDRLQRLRIGYWTCVPISNELAAEVISAYLETEHRILGIFDADAILDDLVECRTGRCSALLVSSLLFLACQMYTYRDVSMAQLSIRFFDEAHMLCQGERGDTSDSTVHTMAAMMMFIKACFFHGRDTIGYEVIRSAYVLARRLGLWGVPPDDENALALLSMSDSDIRTAAITAWESYNFLAFVANLYPSEPIPYPPILPPPDPSKDPGLRHLSPFFPIVCKISVVAQEAHVVYGANADAPIPDRVPVAFIEARFRKLLRCMEDASVGEFLSQNSSSHALVFHMWFHMAVLKVLEPFITVKSCRLESFNSSDSSPNTIYNASINQLLQLILWSCAQGRLHSINVYVNASFLALLGALLKRDPDKPRETSKRLYFLLCIRVCADLYVAYPVYANIAQAYLTMGIRHGVISGAEASALFEELKRRGLHHDAPDKAVATPYVEFEPASTEPEKTQVHVLASQFEGVSLLDQFTTMEYVAPSEVEQGTE
ncbi:conidial development fluffy [Echria macrotheca]|uniref:Conidial development fluffy n=1 Tax=Echria macrotheca TaxID=438768 RepID=A0AAJ0BJN5_9PEZI|nr:conidial development fluffy [Echria macrotheca]